MVGMSIFVSRPALRWLVPVAVLAQAWRGGSRQASLVRLLAMCITEPMSDAQARRVGVLSGQARHDDVVDVVVVEGALRRHDAIVTSDPEDIARIAAAAKARPRIEIV